MRLIVAFLLMFLGHAATAQTRHALVIGIDEYAEVVQLEKAVNDARAVAGALTNDGYEVTLADTAETTTQDALIRTIARFAQEIEPGDVALVFFAGHGVEIQGSNLLIPSDVPNIDPSQEGSERMLETRSLSVDQLTEDLRQRSPRAVVLILDACRDNPLARSDTRTLGGVRGLGGMNVSTDVFVLYSAGIGQTALDTLDRPGFVDPDPNSVFTRSLLPLLSEPGLHPADIARRLRGEVADLAATVNHEQRPAYYDELPPDFALVVAEESAPVTLALAVEPTATGDDAGVRTAMPDETGLIVADTSPDADQDAACAAGDAVACQRILTATIPSDPARADRTITAVLASTMGREAIAALIVTALDTGMDRDLVEALQRRLSAEAGYSGGIDGIAGSRTLTALEEWSKNRPSTVVAVAPLPQVVIYPFESTVTRTSQVLLSPEARNAFDTEFATGSYYGAFATSKEGGWGYAVSTNSLEAARDIAIERCDSANTSECFIMAELTPDNMQPTNPGDITLTAEAAALYQDVKTNVQFHALAVSEDGAFSKVWNEATQSAADQAALTECESYRGADVPDLRDMPCMLLPAVE